MGLQRVVGRGPGGNGCRLINMVLESENKSMECFWKFWEIINREKIVLSTSRGFIFTHTSGGGVATSVVRVSLFWRKRQVRCKRSGPGGSRFKN